MLAILVFLVVPAVALAGNGNASGSDNGNGNDASPAATTPTEQPASSDPGATTAPESTAAAASQAPQSSAATPDASTQANAADSTKSTGQGNGNANGAENGGANGNANGNSNAAPAANAAAPALTPDPAPPLADNGNGNGNGNGNNPNNANGLANGNNGNQGNGQGNGIDPNQNNGQGNGNSDHAGNANANANSSQDKPKNVNVNVRVDQPGDNGAVAQGNNSNAAAAAGASGGSSGGAGASQQTAVGAAGSAGSAASPSGSAAPAPSQADSTGGETIAVANSPPGNVPASDPAGAGGATTATTAPTGDTSPTVLNTSPSASSVNGASADAQTASNGATTGSSQPEVTNVTGPSAGNTTPNGGEATPVTPDYTASNGQISITLPADDATDGGTGDGTSSTTVGPDDGVDDTVDPGPTVTITAPAPTGSSSVNSADATATSTQLEPTNVNASVRILSPGDNGSVSQTNDSTAVAAAGANGGAATALPQATSTQVDPHNINVSIRVGSPGDDAPVTQVNNSTATATPVDPAAIEEATVNLPPGDPNSAADVENVSGIIQDLGQCPEESTCVANPTPTTADSSAACLPAADQSTATAVQQAPSNVSVSIRVASPGMDGIVNQLNGANSGGATAVTTTTDPENVLVAVVVPGNPADVSIPTDANIPWNWNWTWTTGAAPTTPDATPISSPDWNWNWTAPVDETTTTSDSNPAGPAAVPGHWTWTWVWTRGDGWTTTWTYDQPCSCTWSWTWTWTWPGTTQDATQTNAAPAELPAPPVDPQIVQTNTSSAAAAALTTFDGTQTSISATDGDPVLATEYQGITSDQNAIATADAAQLRPVNLNVVTAGRIQKNTQVNETVAAASAAAFDTATQAITQNQAGTQDGAVHAVDAAQVIVTAQNATANAQSAQADAANVIQIWSQALGNQALIGAISQANRAVSATYAAVASETTQIADQSQIGGGADQLAASLQAAIIAQAHQAAVQVAQASVKNRATIEIPWNGVWNPPIDQSNNVSAVAVSTAYSGIWQTVVQAEAGDGIDWDEHAVQTAVVTQSGSASGGAAQGFRENVAGWNGVLASDAGDSGASAGLSFASSTATPSTDAGMIFGTAPARIGGVLGVSGYRFVWLASAASRLNGNPGVALTATDSAPPAAVAHTARAVDAGSSQYRHLVLNLLSAMSSTLGLFFGTTPFAALLALFMIAALAVGRLQYAAPALGRSADFARRERPG
ncbi:MAG: hypothetical protein WCF27_08890 [Gaiellaceae bacterium]